MTANVRFGELWLDHRLGEQLKSGSEVTGWDVQDRLQPRQGDLDAEARTLGLQMLSEGFARMRAGAFVQSAGADRGDTFPFAVLRAERQVHDQVSGDDMLAG